VQLQQGFATGEMGLRSNSHGSSQKVQPMQLAPHEVIQNARRIIGRGQGWIDRRERLLRAVRFCRRRLPLFWGRLLCTVTSWTRDSNRAAADAPVELFLFRLGVWRLVDAHAVDDFHDHRDLLSSLRNTLPLTDRRNFF
jgi:hypothetical protein